ncbi:MAG: hypothetical protein PHU71_03675 [Candidatus Gracilibacteria bacterium]|nr:hypothetical protein [Candidatus Gracilibacteria bacterium]
MSVNRTEENGQVIYIFEGDLTGDKGALLKDLEQDAKAEVRGIIFDLSKATTPGRVPIAITEANPENAVVILPQNAEDPDWSSLWDAERAATVDGARAKVKLMLQGFDLTGLS